jgi:hypothetical protein
MAADLTEDERTELERLRHEVAELRAQATGEGAPPGDEGGPDARPGPGRTRPRARWALALVLVVVASLLAPVALVARYARSELLDTDRYVSTVAPLASDPAVQDTVTDLVTQAIFTRLDVEEVTREALGRLVDRGAPEVVLGLGAPIADQVESFTRNEVAGFVSSEQFAELWVRANRVAHDKLEAVLTGETDGAVQVDEDQVTLDLGEVVARVQARLVDRGFDLAERIPEVDAQLTILRSDELARAQTSVRRLDRSATLLPFVILAFVAAAVVVAPNRRRALLAAALGITLSMILVATALAFVRAWYLDHGTERAIPKDTAVTIVQTLLVPLRTSLRAVVALGVVVSAAAFLAGPSGAARAVRRTTVRATTAVRERVAGERPPSAVESWVAAHRTPLRAGVVAAAAMVFVLWSYPSAGVVVAIVLVALAALLVVELVGRDVPAQPAPPAG